MLLAVAIGDVVVVCTGLLSMQTPWQLSVEEIFSRVYLSITKACTMFFCFFFILISIYFIRISRLKLRNILRINPIY